MQTRLRFLLYWIYLFFCINIFSQTNYIPKDTVYATYPNEIHLNTFYAYINDVGGGCIGGENSKCMQIGGLKEGGFIEFTVPNIEDMSVEVKGTGNEMKGIVRIYRDNILIREIPSLDEDHCERFSEHLHLNVPVTYRITAGDPESSQAIAINSIEVRKYISKSDSKYRFSKDVKTAFLASGNILAVDFPEKEHIVSAGIFNPAGKLLQQIQAKGKNSFEVNLEKIPTGVYLLKVTVESGHQFTKEFIRK